VRHATFAASLGLTLGIAACAGESASLTGSRGVVRFLATNELLAPVTISIDDTADAILWNGQTLEITVRPSAQYVIWESAKPADRNGVRVSDDIAPVKIRAGSIGESLVITNIVKDIPYITASILNETTSEASIGIFNGTGVTCASWLPAKAGTVHGFTQTGYYRYLAGITEFRAYRDPTQCAGPYSAWPLSAIAAYAPRSGLVVLTLTTPP
jgi:hypothetical protein